MTRLMGALLLELHEQWTVGKKYNDMADYHDWMRERETEKLLGMKRIRINVRPSQDGEVRGLRLLHGERAFTTTFLIRL